MIKPYLKYLALILLILFSFYSSYSQNSAGNGINLGIKAGASKLLGEMTYDFSQIINEFENKIGFATSFELSKFITNNFEIGLNAGYSNLNGYTNNPELSAEGNQAGIPSEINDPVEYKNDLFIQDFFARYYFTQASNKSAFIPFVSVGGGLLNYLSKFKYIDNPNNDLLFGKGKEGYTKLSTPVFFLGTGFKSTLSSRFHTITSIDFNFVNYDFLDVVHNYDSEGNRLDLLGIYVEFKIGIYYSTGLFNSTLKRKNKNKISGSSGIDHLPFSR